MKKSPSGRSNNKHNPAKYWYKKAQRLMLSKKYQEALNAYTIAIAHNTEYAEAYFGRGACYYVLGYYRQAVDDINAAALLGCQVAQFWSKFESKMLTEYDDEKLLLEHIFTL